MRLDYGFDDGFLAGNAYSTLQGEGIESRLTYNVPSGRWTGDALVHRLEYSDRDADRAESVLSRFGLMPQR